eukprot:TRINITY_DN956_c0_g4_i1.p1 TRINITY_DN956_c0_g4~~TRINITY_DN956_c0_g4_i1.p1  ORF type:complete len:249 (-),score=68.16 TRINITY_DN956_c0_g4_i1:1324-2070(-)
MDSRLGHCLIGLLLLVCLVGPHTAQPLSYVLWDSTVSNAGQCCAFGGLGFGFEVVQRAKIVRLGVFDSGAPGLQSAKTVTLWDRDNASVLASVVIDAASNTTRAGNFLYVALDPPVELLSGFRGSLVAAGFNVTGGDAYGRTEGFPASFFNGGRMAIGGTQAIALTDLVNATSAASVPASACPPSQCCRVDNVWLAASFGFFQERYYWSTDGLSDVFESSSPFLTTATSSTGIAACNACCASRCSRTC